LPGGRRTAATIVGSPQTLLVWAGAMSDPETDNVSPAENVATGFIFRPGTEEAVAPTATGAAKILPCGDGGPNAIDRPDLSGKSTAEARRAERARGHIVRIVGTDRTCPARTDDLRRDRVNLYSENGIVIWAQMF
jgi:hypothetical protein